MPRSRTRRAPVFDDLSVLEALRLAGKLPTLEECRENGFSRRQLWEHYALSFPETLPRGTPMRQRYIELGILPADTEP